MSALGLTRIKHLVEKAEKTGVNIAFENLHYNDFLSVVMEKFDSPRVGFCFDSGHYNCWTRNEDLLGAYGSRLFALHLHDNNGQFDEHMLLFDATIDWSALMTKIAAVKYGGAVALESKNHYNYNKPARDFLKIAYERARKLEKLLKVCRQ